MKQLDHAKYLFSLSAKISLIRENQCSIIQNVSRETL